MNPLVIALGHRKRVGKNKCCDFLATIISLNTKGHSIKKASFAAALKEQCWALYRWAGLKDGFYYDHPSRVLEKEIVLPAIGKSPRQIWIEYGMAMRAIYQHTWVDYLFKATKGSVIIISDMRFPNEFERVKELGGICIKVNRDSVIPTNDVADIPLSDLPSDQWNHIIENNGTLTDLYNKLDKIFHTNILPKLMEIK